MVKTHLKHITYIGSILFIFLLAACGSSSANTSTPTSTPDQGSTAIVSSPVVSTPVPGNTTPGSGPIVIQTPTPGSGNSQVVILPDRVLTIQTASKQVGVDADSTGISLTMAVKNTGTAAIMNQASYYQLVASEGDTFGVQSSATASFFGLIAPQSSRSGTIVFQVPRSATTGLRLLYRSEIASETVFVSLVF